MATLKILIQDKSDDEVKKILRRSPYFLTYRDKNSIKNDRYLLASTEKSPIDNIVVRECNGIILEKGTHKIICYGIDNILDYKYCNVNDFQNPEAKFIINDCLDGTVIRLYEDDGQWYTSTTRTINACQSFWGSDVSFDTMFRKLISQLDYLRLDPDLTYSFIICGPSNRHIIRYSENKLYLIGARSRTTLKELNIEDPLLEYVVSQCNLPPVYPKPMTSSFTYSQASGQDVSSQKVHKSQDETHNSETYNQNEETLDESQNSSEKPDKTDVNSDIFTLLSQTKDDSRRGVILTMLDNDNHPVYKVKIDFPQFLEYSSIRGNTESIIMRYAELIGHPEKLNALQKLYPEHASIFHDVENDLLNIAKIIQKQYFQKYINHTRNFRMYNRYAMTVRQLRLKHINQKVKITPLFVREHFNTLPSKAIFRILGWI